MRSHIQDMLEIYNCKNAVDYSNALKEIIQEIALLGLSRGGFFHNAAFYGGTALRIFHKLDRFSEDLDFSLVDPDKSFDIEKYLPYVRDELGAFGFQMEVEKKYKTADTAIQSAFIKGGTLIHLIHIASINPPVSGVSANERLRIKLEIDTNPPGGAGYEMKSQLVPVTYSVRLFDLPSLFAGKLHALLCRNWKNRVKGRDWYDFIFFVKNGTPLHLPHLEARIRQTGQLAPDQPLTRDRFISLLKERIASVDFSQAKADVSPFIKDASQLEIWSREFFLSVSEKIIYQ